MSNKIKAAIRVRPFLSSEVKNGYENSKISIDHKKKQIYVSEQPNRRSFHFDYLFSEENTQQELYHGCKIDSMLDRAIEGYHSTIFAYGQTGSGKTHTMQGAEVIEQGSKTQLNGLIPRAVNSLFKKIAGHPQRTFTVAVSFLQIYNEKVFDLLNPASLNPKSLGSNLGGLRLRWNKDQQFTVQNLYVFECKNDDELMKYFLYGLKNRINSAHKLNMSSSRSHSILTIRLQSFHHSDPSHILSSKLELVDLAGSERIGMTGTQGKLAKQSIDINKSLFTLRQVISILSEAGKNKTKQKIHVPYRDSKLTSILKQSIGGNSYSLMIACINPNDTFLQQNLSTLTYATKASYITNQPVVNDDPRSKQIAELKKQIKDLNDELNKANTHIEFISSMNQTQSSGIGMGMDSGTPSARQTQQMIAHHHHNHDPKYATQYSQKLSAEDPQQEGNIPSPLFRRKSSQRNNQNNAGYDQFSERLVESINMVRELLKSNKQLREQLEAANQRNQEKDIQIYELTRENQNLRDNNSPNEPRDAPPPETAQSGRLSGHFKTQKAASNRINPRMMNTAHLTNGNIYGFNTANSKNNFNYWNSVEINQYYMNEKGIDSMPTNFNRRDINSAQNARANQSRGSTAQNMDRHAITAKSTKRSWMSKNSEPKKFLSFYNDPTSKEDSGLY